jgi:uncharacterized membrane protein YeaQ/YmgE (transglycosylase-associated protein family)
VNQAITITIVPAQVITWMFIGAIAGFLAGMIVRGRRFGLLTSVIIGLVGALIGSIIFTVLRIQLPDALNPEISIHLSDILVSFIGAVIVLLIAGVVYRRQGP